jgi:hypothetical protein
MLHGNSRGSEEKEKKETTFDWFFCVVFLSLTNDFPPSLSHQSQLRGPPKLSNNMFLLLLPFYLPSKAQYYTTEDTKRMGVGAVSCMGGPMLFIATAEKRI